jgi:heat shock protein 1/8
MRAVMDNSKVEIIANEQGNLATPSYVAFSQNERLYGDAAENQSAMNPKNTIFDAKRLIGRKFDDEAVQKDMTHWPFTVKDVDGKPIIVVEVEGKEKEFSPQEISAMILTYMKSKCIPPIPKQPKSTEHNVLSLNPITYDILTFF